MRMYDKDLGITFELSGETAAVIDADRNVTKLSVPPEYEGAAVTAIRKKAFLGFKQLTEVILPDTVERIGEWAFTSCDQLAEVQLSGGPCEFGQGVFKNDKRLRRLWIRGRSETCAALLAGAISIMEAEYFLTPESAGSSEWLLKWDQKLENVLRLADDEGYHLYVLCGEEDLHFDYDEYLEFTRRKKAGLCMLRLLWPEELSEELSARLSEYLRAHSLGQKSQAAWDEVVSGHGDDLRYYELLIRLQCITGDNLEAALLGLSDRHAEAKAYLLKQFNQSNKADDFFDGLLL
ncbi:MAG: leucine-rich repeat protein [Lachnospiraceae bacterium]|nr:leucine-rich repeat protein [Lachnospiraceae bacterium]